MASILTHPNFAHLTANRAADNNKEVIFAQLKTLGLVQQRILEMGSGTGQQGIHFCWQGAELTWQPSEQPQTLSTLTKWQRVAQALGVDNFLPPLCWNIAKDEVPDVEFDAIYSSNVLHIISHELAQSLVERLTVKLTSGQRFICYGPFKYNQAFTTESNQEFDLWLKSQGYGGLIDVSDVPLWSQQALQIEHMVEMPANNFLLVYQKQ